MTRRHYLLALVAFAIVHALVAVSVPVSGDEAYYWDCSRHLAWSYFDQPPLAIWAIVPFRALLGNTRLAVRAPAIIASFLIGLFFLPLARRLGADRERAPRDALVAYLVLHAMPLFLLGSSYESTDIVMAAAWLGATWAAVAIAQGERRAWWGFGIAAGLGFLAKFPIVFVVAALAPALLRAPVRRDVKSPMPYLAALVSLALTAPVWIWGSRHGWDNIRFQLERRGEPAAVTLKYLGEFVAGNALLATPFAAAALVVAWLIAVRRWRTPGWGEAAVSAAAPLVAFGAFSLRGRVSPHWGAPGLVVAALLVALVRFRWRRRLLVAGGAFGVAVCALVVVLVADPEPLLSLEWSYRGRPQRISTDKVADIIGNEAIARAAEARRRPDELVASESYTMVHLLAFLSDGALPTRFAHAKPGKHGLASLYWYTPAELRGRDVVFVTEKEGVDAPLERAFRSVTEEEPLVIRFAGEPVRRVRFLRCLDLLEPEGLFTRLPPGEASAPTR